MWSKDKKFVDLRKEMCGFKLRNLWNFNKKFVDLRKEIGGFKIRNLQI